MRKGSAHSSSSKLTYLFQTCTIVLMVRAFLLIASLVSSWSHKSVTKSFAAVAPAEREKLFEDGLLLQMQSGLPFAKSSARGGQRVPLAKSAASVVIYAQRQKQVSNKRNEHQRHSQLLRGANNEKKKTQLT